jgi:Ni/Co efflux regulator RcnB
MIMKAIASALVALSVLAGVAASTAQAAEFGSREYWIERSRNMN